MLIRCATPEDSDAMLVLLNQLFGVEQYFCFDAPTQHRGLAMLLASSLARVFVAEAEGVVRGMATGQLVVSTAQGGLSVLVEDVVVDEGWRRRGIGTLLLAELQRWASSQGAGRMQLLADRDNETGLMWYRRHGWQHTNLICLRNTSWNY
jgi:GNAT superfamily N-acetyltransferase